MTSEIALAAGRLRCQVLPGLGASIGGLWFGQRPVLAAAAPGELRSARQAGCHPLVAFSGGDHAALHWQGTSHPQVQRQPPEPHAVHGLGWQRPWTVLEADDRFALLAYEHRADAAWPYAFDVSQTLRLGEDSLELSLSLTNQAATPAPASLGWAPRFLRGTRSHLRFQADPGLDADGATLVEDRRHDNWAGTLDLHAEALHVRLASNLRHLVVYADPRNDFVTLAPVSPTAGARLLAPGATLTADLTLTFALETNR